MGDAVPSALVSAVDEAGYSAEVIEDEQTRRERQQVSAQQAMRRFRWQAIAGAAGRRADDGLGHDG